MLPLVVWLIVALAAGTVAWKVGLFGYSQVGESCDLFHPPCNAGLSCAQGVCQYAGGIPFGYWLDKISLSNLFCGSSFLVSGLCKTFVPVLAGVVVAVLVVAPFVASAPVVLAVPAVIGFLAGIVFFNVVNQFWWLALLAAALIGFLGLRK